MFDRHQVLEQLIALTKPLSEILKSLHMFSWDSKESLIELKRSNIRSILERYLQSSLTAEEVEDWANAIEGREDIKYETKYESIILLVIHELANPLITRSFNKQAAQELINKLG